MISGDDDLTIVLLLIVSVGIIGPILLNATIGGLCGYFMPGISVVGSACRGVLLSIAVFGLELFFLWPGTANSPSAVLLLLAIPILLGAVATYLLCRRRSSERMRGTDNK